MKTKKQFIVLLAVLFGLAIDARTLISQSASETPIQGDGVIFSGTSPIEQYALTSSTVIFIGKTTQDISGPGFAKAPAGHKMYDALVQVAQILKGSIDSPATVTLFIRSVEPVETPPKAGSPYIFFVEQHKWGNNVYIFIPATQENINKVKQLISEPPK